jgi:Flp pilus assembly protein TadG
MKRSLAQLIRRFVKSDRGQGAVVAVMSMSVMLALGGASIETGHVYYAYQRLVASTNAAALAGAQAMPDTTEASTNVTRYSSEAGQLNANGMLSNASVNPSFLCLNTVSNSLNVPCQTSNGASGGYNALKVTQTAKVNLWFGGLIGMSSMNMSASATAAMRGGTNAPWNIAIILDATPSMDYQDSGAQCSGTQLYCAKQGIQALLSDLYPCAVGQTCTSGSSAVDSVSLFVFPPVTSSTVYKDYTCNSGKPTAVAYTFLDPPTNTTLPSGDTYQVIGFSNDYKTTDTATSLNTSSNLVTAASGTSSGGGWWWYGGGSSCSGVTTRYEWTSYAQVIYTAQTALAAQQAANPNSKNAIVFLSDGDANASAMNAYTAGGGNSSTPISLVASEGKLNGTGTSSTNPSGYNAYAYPSALGQCGQAVLAAQASANAGTVFYTIGYGSPVSGSCNTDKIYSTSVTTNGGSWAAGKQGCDALKAMASAEANFYSDDGSGCEATVPSNQSITKLTAIFRAITDNLTTPRLIPNGTN